MPEQKYLKIEFFRAGYVEFGENYPDGFAVGIRSEENSYALLCIPKAGEFNCVLGVLENGICVPYAEFSYCMK